MKDEIVLFKVGALARKKGFNIYHKRKEYLYSSDGTEIFVKSPDHSPEFFGKRGNVIACTQSLLQRWLREIHKIHISVEPKWIISLRGIAYYFIVKVHTGKFQDIKYQSIRKYKTHEESLEVGLFEALKLIE